MNPSVFDGDGRNKVQPTNTPEGSQPMAVTKAQARRYLRGLEAAGESHHSARGQMVWIVVQHCMEQDLQVDVVRYERGLGFACYITR